MHNHVISEKKKVTFGVLFCEETLHVLVDIFVKILTRKHEKDLKLNWYSDTILSSETDLL